MPSLRLQQAKASLPVFVFVIVFGLYLYLYLELYKEEEWSHNRSLSSPLKIATGKDAWSTFRYTLFLQL